MVTDIVSDMVEESWCILQSWQSSKKVNKKKLHFHWSTELVFLYFFATLRINVLLTRSNYYKLNSKALTSSEYNKQSMNTGKKNYVLHAFESADLKGLQFQRPAISIQNFLIPMH